MENQEIVVTNPRRSPDLVWTPDKRNINHDHRSWIRLGDYTLHLWVNQPMIDHVWQVVYLDGHGHVHILESTTVFSVNQSKAALEWAEAAVKRHLSY